MQEAVATTTSATGGSATVVIDADASVVYELVSDVTGYGRFSPENRSARWLGGASGPEVGARFRSWNRRGPLRWFTHCRVATAEPGRTFAFTVVFPPPMPATRWTYRLDTEGARTRLEESWELPKPLGPARRAMMRLFIGVQDRPATLTAGAAETVARIREVCEAAKR
ncbi:MAG TPA: SRPBCC family protein [Actinomycetales bacterium]|nr:SRPBCC family protein [Actinomycetales bacterium]